MYKELLRVNSISHLQVNIMFRSVSMCNEILTASNTVLLWMRTTMLTIINKSRNKKFSRKRGSLMLNIRVLIVESCQTFLRQFKIPFLLNLSPYSLPLLVNLAKNSKKDTIQSKVLTFY